MNCQYCNKNIFSSNYNGRFYCSMKCNRLASYYRNHEKNKIKLRLRSRKNYTTEKSRNYYLKNKNNPFYREMVRNNLRLSYQRNKNKWNERSYVNTQKSKIWLIIGKKCLCDKEAKHIHHQTYEFPKRSRKGTKLMRELYLKEYCKYLRPLCSKCHQKEHSLFSK